MSHVGQALERLWCQESLWLTQSLSVRKVDSQGFYFHTLTFDTPYDVSRQSKHSRGFDPEIKHQQSYSRPFVLKGVFYVMEGCQVLAIDFWIPESRLVGLITMLLRPSNVFVAIWGDVRVYTCGEERHLKALIALPHYANFDSEHSQHIRSAS